MHMKKLQKMQFWFAMVLIYKKQHLNTLQYTYPSHISLEILTAAAFLGTKISCYGRLLFCQHGVHSRCSTNALLGLFGAPVLMVSKFGGNHWPILTALSHFCYIFKIGFKPKKFVILVFYRIRRNCSLRFNFLPVSQEINQR